ncbi:MAG: aldehyde dehydrogenase family protein [Gammaproteobacteria bacterium]
MNVRNPRTGEIDVEMVASTEAEIAATVAEVRAAQPSWYAAGIEHRVAALRQFAAELTAHRDEVCQALIVDTGRVVESYQELDGVCNAIDHWCDVAPALLARNTPSPTRIPFVHSTVGHTPYAVAGVIAPWNFPLLLSFIDAIPGLLAGCALVLKPSEVTPRFVTPLQRVLDRVPPLRQVLRLICGGAAAGRSLTGKVDLMCFTGSVATGKQVAVAAAQHFIPVHLELGGKDPAVVFADADLPRAAAAISWGGTVNAGQSCLSIERVYVERSVHDAFVGMLVRATQTLALNRETLHEGQIGPLINGAQADVIDRHLSDAVASGAIVRCGGRLIRDGGVWCEPTVLTNVNHTMLVMREETFGPILPVMPFEDEKEAIRLANDTNFGLSAAVFTDEAERLSRVARRLDAGAVSANDACLTSFVHEGAKQAFKDSGLGGSRMGNSALARFYRSRVTLENVDQAWDPWWFEQTQGGKV